jgi:hypothetical protein
MSISSEIELELGPSRIKDFLLQKHLIREGPNSSSIPEHLDNLSKNPDVPFVVI